jgi:hypothetical protein
MLIDMDLRNHISDVGWLQPMIIVTGSTYKVRCCDVSIRCGDEVVVAGNLSLRSSHDASGGTLDVFASEVPQAFRTAISAETEWLAGPLRFPEPVDIGGLVLPAGTMALSAQVVGRGAHFTAGPVSKDAVGAFIERQMAERAEARAARAATEWQASG